jgi:hypothetical protein
MKPTNWWEEYSKKRYNEILHMLPNHKRVNLIRTHELVMKMLPEEDIYFEADMGKSYVCTRWKFRVGGAIVADWGYNTSTGEYYHFARPCFDYFNEDAFDDYSLGEIEHRLLYRLDHAFMCDDNNDMWDQEKAKQLENLWGRFNKARKVITKMEEEYDEERKELQKKIVEAEDNLKLRNRLQVKKYLKIIECKDGSLE